jgi:hypothetical protein
MPVEPIGEFAGSAVAELADRCCTVMLNNAGSPSCTSTENMLGTMAIDGAV